MRIVHIVDKKYVEIKNKRELEEYFKTHNKSSSVELEFFPPTKEIKLKEPTYLVEMSAKEIQLVSFYLELENRKPIMNIELETKIAKGENDDE